MRLMDTIDPEARRKLRPQKANVCRAPSCTRVKLASSACVGRSQNIMTIAPYFFPATLLKYLRVFMLLSLVQRAIARAGVRDQLGDCRWLRDV